MFRFRQAVVAYRERSLQLGAPKKNASGFGEAAIVCLLSRFTPLTTKSSSITRRTSQNPKSTTEIQITCIAFTTQIALHPFQKSQHGADAVQEDGAQIHGINNQLCRHARLSSTPSNGTNENAQSSQDAIAEESYQEGKDGDYTGPEASIN
jgi:hypothetical protein